MDKKYSIEDASTSKIKAIAQDFLLSNLSLRSFSDTYCAFSHVTLRDKLLNNLPTIDKELFVAIKAKLEAKRAKSVIEDSASRLRTLYAVKLLIEKDLTIPEIALELNTTEMTIYRDLTRRVNLLEEVDNNLKKQILLKLKEHKDFNLTKGRR